MLVLSLDSGLDVIFDLGLGLLTALLVLEVEGRGDLVWQESLELDGVQSWLQHAISDLEYLFFDVEELLLVLHFLMTFYESCLTVVLLSFLPVADE